MWGGWAGGNGFCMLASAYALPHPCCLPYLGSPHEDCAPFCAETDNIRGADVLCFVQGRQCLFCFLNNASDLKYVCIGNRHATKMYCVMERLVVMNRSLANKHTRYFLKNLQYLES